MRLRATSGLALVGALLILLGCGSDASEAVPLPGRAIEGASLILNSKRAEPGDAIRVRVRNGSDQRLEYGLSYVLYREAESGYVKLRDYEPVSNFILLSADPGETAGPEYPPGSKDSKGAGSIDAFVLPDDISSGNYLLARRADKADRGHWLFGQFVVEAGT